MSTLIINSIEVPLAAAGGGSRSFVRIGGRGRAFNGTLRRTERVRKQEWNVATLPVTAAEATAFDGLLEGDGHVWSFDTDLYSSKGLAATGGTTAIGATSPTPKFGAGRLDITTGTVTFPCQLPSTWTVLVWRWNIPTTSWGRWLFDSTGAKYLSGASTGTTTSWFAVTSGSPQLIGAGHFDDLVALPFLVPDAWKATWTQVTAPVFSALPSLSVSGDLTGTRTLQAEITGSRVASHQSAGSWQAFGRELEFILSEV